MTVFVDANVLVYARDSTEASKQPVARAWLSHLWRAGTGRLSLQVLNEYYRTVTHKLDPGLDAEDARDDCRRFGAWRPLPIDASVLEGAWAIEDRFGFAFWDALVVSAAKSLGCDHLLTEDLQGGQDLDGLLVVDPFAVAPDRL